MTFDIMYSTFCILVLGVLSKAVSGSFSLGKDKRFIMKLFWIGVAVRIAIAVFLRYSGNVGYFGPDSITYEWRGWEIANYWRGTRSAVYSTVYSAGVTGVGTRVVYYYLHGVIYYIFGFRPILPQIVNCFVGAFLVFPIYDIGNRLFDRKTARLASRIVMFFPSLVMWSTVNVRDMFIPLICAVILLNVLLLKEKKSLGSLLRIVILLFIMLNVRGYMVHIILLSIMLGIFFPTRRRFFTASVLIFLFIITLRIAMPSSFQTQGITKVDEQLAVMQQVRQGRGVGGRTTVMEETDISTAEGAFNALPAALFYTVFAPFPWKLGSSLQNFTIPEMFLYYYLLFFAVRGMLLCYKKCLAKHSVLIAFILIGTILHALASNNIGTSYRMRAQILPFIFLYSAFSISLGKDLRRK